jgi:uncharacterized cupredoxin-like copper-binding protein
MVKRRRQRLAALFTPLRRCFHQPAWTARGRPRALPPTIEVHAMTHRILRSIPLALLALTIPAFASAAAAEPASVKVNLSDKGGKDRILLSTNHVKAGEVEFEITNTSKSQMHEFLIAPWKGAITKLPYNDKEGAVREAKVRQLQGVEDMKPGAEATLRLSLRPGPYVVFCNQPSHYKLGMEARFTVTGRLTAKK